MLHVGTRYSAFEIHEKLLQPQVSGTTTLVEEAETEYLHDSI